MFSFIMAMVVIVIGVFLTLIFAGYMSHLAMVKEQGRYGKGDFNLFKENFFKCELTRDKIWNNSWFNRDNNSKYHANIIKFNDKGMYMKNPYEYLKVLIFMFEMKKTDKGTRVEVDWYKED